MSYVIPEGVWPTMVTPFTEKNEIDYVGLEKMIEWYIKRGVDGLFAVCQSSEMFFLTLEERVKLAGFVKEKAAERIPVIASGHVSDSIEGQIEEIKKIKETGIDAFVLVSNRLANEDESDNIWKDNAEKILKEVPEISFGIYECPFPYKRLISPDILRWCAETGRFLFLKDTSCNSDSIKAKLQAVEGTELKIYNANTATLLQSLKDGASGYSGVMANFHPDLYAWLVHNWQREPQKAEELINFLGLASVIELQHYPVNAKYYLSLEGINIKIICRSKNHESFSSADRIVVEQLHKLSTEYSKKY